MSGFHVISGHLIGASLPMVGRAVRRLLFHFGGLGLIPLGLLDNCPIPLLGALDVATTLLAARQEQLWLYYALMATAGSMIGGFVTYRLARKGGENALQRRFSRRTVDKFCGIFARWGFSAIAIPALFPPPLPMVPLLLAAGAMQYPARKFLAALALGRISRYRVLAFLAARYGQQTIALIAKHGQPSAVAIVFVLMATATLIFYFWGRLRIASKR